MASLNNYSGVYAAALTPLSPDYTPDIKVISHFMEFLASRGCHGALILGTTGEGPSFSPAEKYEILRSALEVKKIHPGFVMLAGTGTPSLGETVELTRTAFELGYDGVVVLPPYYFRNVSEDGLYTWYSEVIKNAVPANNALFGYHIPQLTGIPLSLDLLARLKTVYPDRLAGVKDSSGDPVQAIKLGQTFGKDLLVLNGNDILFSLALENSASGCITAMANLYSPDLNQIWNSHLNGIPTIEAQSRVSKTRKIFDRYPPNPPLYKAMLAHFFDLPRWNVRPPLVPLTKEIEEKVISEFISEVQVLGPASVDIRVND